MVAWMACSTVVMKGLARWCVDGMLDSCDEGWLLFEKGHLLSRKAFYEQIMKKL